MSASIRHPKDFWTGIIFLIFGLAAVIIGTDYQLGSAGRMGPGYFPSILGFLLLAVGLIAVGRSFFLKGEAIGKFYLKELALVLASVILFALLMRGAGLVPAAVVLVVLSAWASPKFRLGEVLALAVALAAFAVLLFAKLLGLPMHAFGPWFGL